MVDIGYIPPVKSPWLNRPAGKVQSKRRTGREHGQSQQDKRGESKEKEKNAEDNPSFDGYA